MSSDTRGPGSVFSLEDADGRIPEPPELPVDGADSIFEVIGDGEKMKEWLENLEAKDIEKTRQENGDHHNSKTLGFNIRQNLHMRWWPNVLKDLEEKEHSLTGEPPHDIIQHPAAFLDNIVHLTEVDRYRLKYQDLKGLPPTKREMFKYLIHPDHSVGPDDLPSTGGRDAAIYGSPGSGKSTLSITTAARIMEINNEAVVWRGTPARTEWLPLAPWATVVLPEGVDYTAKIAPPKDDSLLGEFADEVDFKPVEIDLEKVVRKVERYSSLSELNNEILEQGAFHVVYPDPKFRECEAVTRRASETKPLDFTSAWDALEDEDLSADDVTPTRFWWFAWAISYVSEGVQMPVSWFCDEVKTILPNGAEKSDHNHPRYIRAFSDKYIDMRRNGLSFYPIGHQLKKHFSHHIRNLMRWSVTMKGASHPIDEDALSGRAPMTKDLTTSMDVGQSLIWNVSNNAFAELPWDDINDKFKVPGKVRITFPGVEGVKEQC